MATETTSIENTTQIEFEFHKVKSAQVNLEVGACFFRQNNRSPLLIKESTFWQPIDIDLKIGLVPKRGLPSLQKTSDVYVIPREKNYYHWMFDILPYIIAAHKIDRNLVLVSGENLTKFQSESLNEQMPVCKSKEVWVNATNVLLPKNRHETGFPPSSVLKILTEHFLQMFHLEDKFEGNRIYVSRRNATRAPANELEIEKTLASLGFQILECDKMSLKEQYKAFNNAKIVIGPHGAGLSNLIFCQAGVIVRELIPPSFHNPCYERLSSLTELNYKACSYEEFSSAARITHIVHEELS